MALVPMKKVFVLSLTDYKDELVRQLQKMGILQIVDLRERLQEPEWAELLREDHLSDEISQLDIKLSELKFIIDFVGRYEGRKKSFIESFTGSKVPMTREVFRENAKQVQVANEVYQRCRELEDGINTRHNEISQLQSVSESLKPWLALDASLADIKETAHTNTVLGVIESNYFPKVKEEILEIAPDTFIHVVSDVKKMTYLLITYHKASEEGIATALRNHSFSRVLFSDLHNTPYECLRNIAAKEEKLQREADELIQLVLDLISKRDIVMSVFEQVSAERDQLLAVKNFARTDRTFAIEGWVKQKDLDRLIHAVKQISEESVVDVRDPEVDEEAPVVLINHRLIRPFEAVTELYALPISGGFDPTPFLAPFFFLFFGMMLGDVGYGIGLCLLTFVLMKKIKMAGLGKKLFELLFLGGVASILVGLLTGSFFGDLFPIKPLWFSPTIDPMRMIGVALGFGVFQVIYVGLGLKMYLLIKKKRYMEAIFDVGSWLALFTGSFVFFGAPMIGLPAWLATVGQVLMYTGLLSIIFMTARGQRNPLKRIGSGLYALYGISGYLGDVLSYSRLLALGLASAVIAQVFNTMGYMVRGTSVIGLVIMVVFLAGAHTFNLLINVLGSFVHASRLQFVEFFGKFYESGGKKFQPFDVSTKYVDIE